MYENYGTGVYGPYYNAGVPGAGTDEVQTATFGGTWLAGDKFRLVFNGYTTGLVSWSATTATLLANINTALNALPNLGTSWVVATDSTLSSGLGNVLLTFSGGDVSKRAVPTMTIAGNTSAAGTLAIAETTPGVTATYRDVQKGAIVVDTTNAKEYIKTGNTGTGTYTVVGAQS